MLAYSVQRALNPIPWFEYTGDTSWWPLFKKALWSHQISTPVSPSIFLSQNPTPEQGFILLYLVRDGKRRKLHCFRTLAKRGWCCAHVFSWLKLAKVCIWQKWVKHHFQSLWNFCLERLFMGLKGNVFGVGLELSSLGCYFHPLAVHGLQDSTAAVSS